MKLYNYWQYFLLQLSFDFVNAFCLILLSYCHYNFEEKNEEWCLYLIYKIDGIYLLDDIKNEKCIYVMIKSFLWIYDVTINRFFQKDDPNSITIRTGHKDKIKHKFIYLLHIYLKTKKTRFMFIIRAASIESSLSCRDHVNYDKLPDYLRKFTTNIVEFDKCSKIRIWRTFVIVYQQILFQILPV